EAARAGNLAFLDNLGDFLEHVVVWLLAAVVPGELDRRQPVAGREVEADDRPFWRTLRAEAGRFRLDGRRLAELQGHERQVGCVACHVAQGAGAVIPPAAPAEGQVRLVVSSLLGDAEPQVPLQGRRHFLGGWPFGHALGPDRPIAPDVYLLDR